MTCAICNHPDRYLIEKALAKSDTIDLSEIAKNFDVNENDLKVHILMHTSLISSTDEQIEKESIARSIKKKEADMLTSVANEYLTTLSTLGNVINSVVGTGPDGLRAVSKPTVEMYLGLGREVRETVKSIAELDNMLNGQQDPITTGLESLARAIRGE